MVIHGCWQNIQIIVLAQIYFLQEDLKMNIGFFNVQYMTAELCGGGLMLGAWFMATDYVTSPITSKGKILFGICQKYCF